MNALRKQARELGRRYFGWVKYRKAKQMAEDTTREKRMRS